MKARSVSAAVLVFGLTTIVQPLPAQDWITSGAPKKYWQYVACSTNGETVVAVQNAVGGISVSTNFGATWTTAGVSAPEWGGVAASGDGARLYASVHSGPIYTSTNRGTTWTPTGAPGTNWGPLACSADGAKIIAACTDGIFEAPLYISMDFGATWTPARAGQRAWKAVACSADAANMYALAEDRFFYSRDSGRVWHMFSSSINDWWHLACSADGNRLIASVRFGSILTSTNGGLDWFTNGTPPAGLMWPMLASSADGNTLLAAGAGSIYTSTNAGGLWVSNNVTLLSWIAVACSADGNKLIACSDTRAAPIYVAHPIPQLSVRSQGDKVLASWPASATGFTLEQSTSLAAPIWSTVSNGVASGVNQFTITPTGDGSWYRLRYP